MKNEMVFRGLRTAVFAAVMFTSASLFAIAPNAGGGDGGAMVGPVNDGGNISRKSVHQSTLLGIK